MKNFNNFKNHWSKSPNREKIKKQISEIIKEQFKNGRKNWCEGTKGICKSNSGSFKKGLIPWNKGEHPEYMQKENNSNWQGGISKNPKYILERQREYVKNHRLMYRINARRRKLQLSDLDIKIVQQVYEDNIKQYGTLTCYLCLKLIEFGQDCLEHKIPLSKKGNNSYDNLAVAHRKCNSIKGTKTETEYREYISRYD